MPYLPTLQLVPVHAASSEVWPLREPNLPFAHGTHTGVVGSELSIHPPGKQPIASVVQSLLVASQNVPEPQSAAEVAHTVDAASLGSRQQQRRWTPKDDVDFAPQVEEAAELAGQ